MLVKIDESLWLNTNQSDSSSSISDLIEWHIHWLKNDWTCYSFFKARCLEWNFALRWILSYLLLSLYFYPYSHKPFYLICTAAVSPMMMRRLDEQMWRKKDRSLLVSFNNPPPPTQQAKSSSQRLDWSINQYILSGTDRLVSLVRGNCGPGCMGRHV